MEMSCFFDSDRGKAGGGIPVVASYSALFPQILLVRFRASHSSSDHEGGFIVNAPDAHLIYDDLRDLPGLL